MLKTRVITALALVALLLPSLFWLPQTGWALLVAAFIGIAAWEWGALLGWRSAARIVLGVATAALCGGVALAWPDSVEFRPGSLPILLVYGLSTAFWAGVLPFWLRGKWSLGALSGFVVGAVVLLPTWLAMVQLRALGPAVLLGVFAVVWMADIAAYFAGRAFGRHKLAPAISPGKTWEGVFGAAAGVLAYGLIVRATAGIELLAPLPWIGLLLLVTAVSVVGDLFESLLKRKAGIKDSSNVLPGHGGVLDRIDSLTSTLPVVAFLLMLLLPPA